MRSQREELIAGALTGDLSDAEWKQLNQARSEDPSIDAELEELRAMAARLDEAEVAWREGPPPAGLKERVLSATFEAD
ncbi:hypothetical protein [Nesterenkonia sp. CF4.4]|uniref:hypothetical protein n=1 Tax=Nesterenkonia sp. CF4.4 TaxID=3373079 RepID=UPI003EE48FC2